MAKQSTGCYARKKNTRGTEHKRVEATFIEPMHCKAVTSLPEDEQWRFEIKFDGYRCIAVRSGSEVTLFSRNRNVLNDRFPNLVEALDQSMATSSWTEKSSPSMSKEDRRFSSSRTPGLLALSVYFYVFDLLNPGRRSLAYRRPLSDGANG